MKPRTALVALAVLHAGCAETGQDRTRIALFVAGTQPSGPITAVADVLVSIDRADLAFGPLYLCAGATAGDLCDTARLEWLDTVVVNTLAPEPAPAGELVGITGPVQSWMYDLGISSQLTRSAPFILAAANELGGASFVLEGRAVVGGLELPFSASVPVQQTDDTELGVPVVRKSTSESFFRDVRDGDSDLVVRFDPEAWVRRVDFRPYAAADACAPDGPAITCDGAVERTCAGETELSRRDCSELGEVCLPGAGCARALTIESGSEAFRSLRNELVSGSRPSFEWDYVP